MLFPLAERYAAIGREQVMEIGVEKGIAIGESRSTAKSSIISYIGCKIW
ncbi:MAG: hypothetical protein LBC02_02425 [Planctomycetaceae bacterium]|jgi:hypothetical protein|nr:hypothetical protein [Planctomycetaceae bacterium]